MNNLPKRFLVVMLVFFMCLISSLSGISAYEDHDGENPVEVLDFEETDPSLIDQHQKTSQERSQRDHTVSLMHDDNEEVRVTVVFEELPVLKAYHQSGKLTADRKAMNYRSQLLEKQKAMIDKINGSLEQKMKVYQQLTLAANALSAEIKYGDIKTVEKVDGVKKVILENCYQRMTVEEDNSYYNYEGLNPASEMVNITEAWDKNYTGAGSLVGIIDSGIDYKHISFDPYAFEYSIKQIERETGTKIELRDEDFAYDYQHYNLPGEYLNLKIPYYYNYVDNDLDITHENDKETNHGSHVAGIIAANRYLAIETDDPAKADFSYKDDQTDHYLIMEEADTVTKAIGTAPDAQLAIFKVFGKKGGAWDGDILKSLEHALILGCDSVNLSLGADYGTSYYTGFDEFYDTIVNNSNGMVVCFAAGNAGTFPDYYGNVDVYAEDAKFGTVSFPGTATDSLTVASADSIGYGGQGIEYLGRTLIYNDYYSAKFGKITDNPGTYEFIYMDADAADINNIKRLASKEDFTGKILIFNANYYDFVGTIERVLAGYSPAGIIVANTENRMYTGMSTFSAGLAPIAYMSNEDIVFVRENTASYSAGKVRYYKGSFTVTGKPAASSLIDRSEATISDFSSWGAPESLLMKPEITAVGGSVYSVYGCEAISDTWCYKDHDFYGTMSGTSMATPQMTALSAIVKQHVERTGIHIDGYSNRAVTQSLLMSTATPMFNGGDYYSILQQGAGLADVKGALNSRSVIMMSTKDKTLTVATGAAADGKVKVEFGADFDKKGTYTYSFRVYNISDQTVYYQLPSSDIFTQDFSTDKDGVHMLKTTTKAGSQTSFSWITADAQRILDYVAAGGREVTAEYAGCDADGNGIITSHDAHLLLNAAASEPYIPAGSYADVTITFRFEASSKVYSHGAYIEGFTYIREMDAQRGEGVTHSIPILGYYGDWYDTAKFDEGASVIENLYGTPKKSYFGWEDSNFFEFSNMAQWYSTGCTGNQYILEKNNPIERYAVNSSAEISWFEFVAMSGSFMDGLAVDKINGIGGEVDKHLYWGRNLDAFDLSSLEEGDTVRVGYYRFSEYAGFDLAAAMRYDSYSNYDQLYVDIQYREEMMARDKRYGYYTDFTIDNTAPQLISTCFDTEDQILTVEAKDNQNIAYLGIYSFDGKTKYYECAPACGNCSISIDARELANSGSFIVMLADYACNEKSYLVKIGDHTRIDTSLYALVLQNDTYQYAGEFKPGAVDEMTLTDIRSINSYVKSMANGMNKAGNMVTYALDEGGNLWLVNHHNNDYEYVTHTNMPLKEICQTVQLLSARFGVLAGLDEQNRILLFSIEEPNYCWNFDLNSQTGCGEIVSLALSGSGFYNVYMLALDDDNNIWSFTLEPDTDGLLDLDKVYDLETALDIYKLKDAKLLIHLDINEDPSKANMFYTGNVIYLTYDKGDHSSMYAYSSKYKETVYLGDTKQGYVIKDLIQKYDYVGYLMRVALVPNNLELEVGESQTVGINRWNITYTIPEYYVLDESIATVSKQDDGRYWVTGVAPGTTQVAVKVPINNPDPIIEYSTITVTEAYEESDEQSHNSATVIQKLEDPAALSKISGLTAVDNVSIKKSDKPTFNTYINPVIKTKELVITSDRDTTNGYLKISYEDVVNDLVDYKSHAVGSSFIVDEENSCLYVAFAHDQIIKAGDPLLTLHFTDVEGNCAQISAQWMQTNDSEAVHTDYYELDDAHQWQYGKTDWTKLGSGMIASIVFHCSSCGADTRQNMHIISRVKDRFGRIKYTAYLSADEALDGKEHTEYKTVFDIPVIDTDRFKPVKVKDPSVLEKLEVKLEKKAK